MVVEKVQKNLNNTKDLVKKKYENNTIKYSLYIMHMTYFKHCYHMTGLHFPTRHYRLVNAHVRNGLNLLELPVRS